MKRRLIAMLVILAGMLGVLAFEAAPAQADLSQCASGNMCLWGENTYTGCFYQNAGNDGNYATSRWSSYGGCNVYSVNDGANSISNNGNSCRVRLYTDAYGGGASIYFNNPARGGTTRDPMLSNGGGYSGWPQGSNGYNWQDRISSHDWWC